MNLTSLGFDTNKEGFMARNYYQDGDRFGYNIFIDTEVNEILFVQKGINNYYWRDIKYIEDNFNNLNSGIKQFWLDNLKPLGLKDWSKK